MVTVDSVGRVKEIRGQVLIKSSELHCPERTQAVAVAALPMRLRSWKPLRPALPRSD